MNTSDSQLIRVAIVDDHKLVVEGIERIINESGIACVTGKSHNLADSWQMLLDTPDVLLLDIGLPDGNGIDACLKISKMYPELKILMLTSYAEHAVVMSAMDSGATGYVLKNALAEEILEGIKTVMDGGKYFCEEIDSMLKNRSSDKITLSRRERELLTHVVNGLSNAEIADRMCLGYETIRGYRKNLFVKLDVHSTGQLIKLALEMKLV